MLISNFLTRVLCMLVKDAYILYKTLSSLIEFLRIMIMMMMMMIIFAPSVYGTWALAYASPPILYLPQSFRKLLFGWDEGVIMVMG